MRTYKERVKMETDETGHTYRYNLSITLYRDHFECSIAAVFSKSFAVVDVNGLRQQDKAIRQARGIIPSLVDGDKEKIRIDHGVAQLSTARRVVWTYWLDGRCRIVRENYIA